MVGSPLRSPSATLDRSGAARPSVVSKRLDEPFGVLTGLKTPPDLDTFKRLRDEGVTAIINVPWYYSEGPTSSLDHKRDTLNRFAERFIEPLRAS